MTVQKLSKLACAFFPLQTFLPGQTPATGQTTALAQPEFKPITQEERFHHFIAGTFGAESVLRAAAGAAILQATNTPEQMGTRRCGLCAALRE